jgi:hypothetical protein
VAEQPAYAKTIGRMAYVWGWPLVNMINRSPPASSLPGSPGVTIAPGLLSYGKPPPAGGLADAVSTRER